MKKPELDLNVVAEEFESSSYGIYSFYNKKTGEFDFYTDEDRTGSRKFKDKVWMAIPSQQDFNEYRMMVDFVYTVSDPHKNELLCVALEGAGAFRRFKDTLHRVDLTKEWYAFKRKAYVEIAREWCEKNGIKYLGKEINKTEPTKKSKVKKKVEKIDAKSKTSVKSVVKSRV